MKTGKGAPLLLSAAMLLVRKACDIPIKSRPDKRPVEVEEGIRRRFRSPRTSEYVVSNSRGGKMLTEPWN